MTGKKWSDAIWQLELLLQIVPNYMDAVGKLVEAKSQAHLSDLYRRALKAVDAKQWQDAKALLEDIFEVDSNYASLKELLERVQREWWKSRTVIGIDGKVMVLVPEGEFLMGNDLGRVDEKPLHKVYLEAFYISRYPVTNAEYKKFVDATKYSPPSYWSSGNFPQGKENHPVVYVIWNDAVEYCKWADTRLLTEAEWEKAASWDEAKQEKRVYPWGKDFDKNKCNTKESEIGDTTPVDQYFPGGDSAYGVGDMAGNVWEWCADLYNENYLVRPKQLPRKVDITEERVVRGGS